MKLAILTVILVAVVMLTVTLMSAVMLSEIILCVILLNVAAPSFNRFGNLFHFVRSRPRRRNSRHRRRRRRRRVGVASGFPKQLTNFLRSLFELWRLSATVVRGRIFSRVQPFYE